MSKNIINITYNNLTFKVIKLVGNEYLSNHFEFNVTIETESENLIKSGLAQTVKIQFISVDGHTREHTSCLFSIQNLGCFSDRYRYILTLKPRIEILNQQQHSRILIDTNVKQIINNLMVEAGYNKDQIEWRVSQSFDNIPQFIQAQENNFQLLQRLLHQFGLFYWSEPKNNTEIVVFTDNNLHSPYLERGLVEVINADGMNREYVNQFVGFNAINVTHNVVFGSADSHVHSHPPHANKQKCEQQFFEPCANNTAQQNNFSQIQSQANLQNEKVIILTGNIPDVFAGCSISLDDTTHASGSGDYLCIAVKHHLIQVNDESTHNGNNEYHCIATFIPRGTPFKVVAPEQFDKPMVFPATVESLSGSAQLNDQGEYNVRLAFDTTARPQTSASSPLKKLALYACANQNQATGWHFPLIKDAKVLIGCINNDPSNAFILGFALNDNQTSVVDENNPYHNRLLTLAGNELLLDDSPRKAKVVLHTLGQAHYIELNASQGDQFVKWISNYGAINFYSGKNLSIGNTEPMDISFILKNNMFIDINKKYNVTTNNQSIQYQSAGSIDAKGNTIQLNSEQEASLLSGRTLKATAQSEIKINSDNANININVPAGSTFIQADNNINIKGDGSGDIIIHNKGAQIKLSASGDVDIIATDVLTLNGAMTTFDGPVSYDITSPESASEPSVLNQTTIARSPNLDVSSQGLAKLAAQNIELEYLYQDNSPVQNAPYTLTLDDGSVIEGTLDASGKATIENMPAGQYTIQYGEDSREFEPVENTTANPLFGKISPEQAVKMVESGDTDLLNQAGDIAEGAGDWLWGTLQGDFNKDPSTSQIVVGTIISMIPVIDQVMDCRDVCANTMMLTDDEQANDSDGWIALTLTGIGFIPLFGSAVKGVGKVIVKNPKESISLAAATLRKIGKGDPIAYIKNIDWKALGKQGAELIKEKISAIQAALTAITNSNAVKWFVDKDLLDNLRKQSKQLSELLPKVDAGIKNAIAVIENKVKRALKSYEGELPHTGKTGDVKKVKTDELTAPKGNDLKGAPPRVINLKQGEKGGWNKALNGKLEPHATYKVGKYTYKTDELGRVKSVGGELDLSKVDRNTYQQGKAGKTDGIKDGLSDDEGGHLIASIFKGPGEQINYAAMDGNLNKGAWKRMENKWAKALKGDPPKKVEVEINAIYDGDNKRPSAFEVFYEIDGIEEMKKLKNAPGG